MRFLAIAAIFLLTLSAQTSPKPAQKTALDKATLEAYVRHLLAVMSEVQVKIDDPKPTSLPDLKQVDVHFTYGNRSQDETFFVSADGQQIIRGFIYGVNENPFKADLEKLKTDLAPSYGSPGAPVVLVAFSDFECPNCKEEALALHVNLEKAFPGQVRFYFKDFPLEQIHPWAKPAAIAGRCIFRQDPAAFWKYHDWIYEQQANITPENFKSKLLEYAQVSNLDGIQLGRCVDTKATEADIDKSIAEARALRIDATPTLFVNGRRLVGNYPWQNIQTLISGELNYQKAAHDAGEKCCEVSIPTALSK
jgi:protein-disulfide isomerase